MGDCNNLPKLVSRGRDLEAREQRESERVREVTSG
jgi:hypothetical protein